MSMRGIDIKRKLERELDAQSASRTFRRRLAVVAVILVITFFAVGEYYDFLDMVQGELLAH